MERKEFTKDDIKVGYVVLLRNGEYRMVTPVGSNGTLILSGNTGWDYFSTWDENLCKKDLRDFLGIKPLDTCIYDIIKVFGYIIGTPNYRAIDWCDPSHRLLLWERKESKKMTVAEIEKELGYSVEIVAEK